MSNTIEIEKFLVRLDIFKTFNDKEIRKIVPGFMLIHSQKDDVLVHEDEVANQLYIVKTGSVAIWKNFNKKKRCPPGSPDRLPCLWRIISYRRPAEECYGCGT